MTSDKLGNLVRVGKLKEESPSENELRGLERSGLARLADARRQDLSFESRFDLAYNAAHALALYALRRNGYRSANRYLVFQLLPQTAGMSAGTWRVLAKAHERRNLAEYEGYLERDDQLLADLISATRALAAALGVGEGR
jgi:hypothetical protein